MEKCYFFFEVGTEFFQVQGSGFKGLGMQHAGGDVRCKQPDGKA
jgi:hypothetical protein